MEFEFATASRVIFGNGSLSNLGKLVSEMGKRAFLVGGASVERMAPAQELIEARDLPVILYQVPGEPTLEIVRRGVELARQNGCDIVVAIGGGSAIDAGKAIAAIANNPGDILDYLEVIGRGRALEQAGLPFIAIPTTAGTGSEVTRNAVVASHDHGVKASLRSMWMYPKVALVDPELTYALPPSHTAACGMDALTQLIEPFTCNHTTPIVDALCEAGIRLAARYLRTAYGDGKNPEGRESMSLASLYGGIALANARVGAVHGFAAPIGGTRSAAHGAVCARLLPVVVECNLKALRERAPASQSIDRYRQIARICTGKEQAHAEELVSWLYVLREDLAIPTIASYGFGRDDIPALVDKASQASSMKGNPLQLTNGEMEWILNQAW
jgi:alcohol dehydrogenase class IV